MAMRDWSVLPHHKKINLISGVRIMDEKKVLSINLKQKITSINLEQKTTTINLK